MKRTLVLAAALLSGCATSSLIEPVQVVVTPSSSDPVPVVAIVETGPPVKDWRNKVTGRDCQRMAWEPKPTNENAVRDLLDLAASRGFNAVHSVVVGVDLRSLALNCWEATTATGIAFNDPSRPAVPPSARKPVSIYGNR